MSEDSALVAGAVLDPARLGVLCAIWQAEGCDTWITLQGGSMAPTFLPGTRLHLRYGRQDIAVGDVIVYRQADVLVVHRVIAVTPEPSGSGRHYQCLGDGNVFPDAPVPESVVVGVIVGAENASWLRTMRYNLRHPRRYFRNLRRVLTRRTKAIGAR